MGDNPLARSSYERWFRHFARSAGKDCPEGFYCLAERILQPSCLVSGIIFADASIKESLAKLVDKNNFACNFA
jgi:hypothetical protein